MASDPEREPIIEAEVLEIDGKVPPPPLANARPSATLRRSDDDDEPGQAARARPWAEWQRWPGQARTLNPLWWPVILVVGSLLLGLLLTLGLFVAIIIAIFRLLRALLRALFA